MRISDWSSDVCSSDLLPEPLRLLRHYVRQVERCRQQCRVLSSHSMHRDCAPRRQPDQHPGHEQSAIPPALPVRSLPESEPALLFVCVLPPTVSAHPCRKFPEQWRSEEHTSELPSLMRISYPAFSLKKNN